jgi:hypothetical protein
VAEVLRHFTCGTILLGCIYLCGCHF